MAPDHVAEFDMLSDEELWTAVYRDSCADCFWVLADRYRPQIILYALRMTRHSDGPEEPARQAEDFYHWCLADELARRWRFFDPARGFRLKTYTKTIVPSLWAEYYRKQLEWAVDLVVRSSAVDDFGVPVFMDSDANAVSADVVLEVCRSITNDRKYANVLKGRAAYILESFHLPVWRAYGESASKYLRERLKIDPEREADAMIAAARTGGEFAVRDLLCERLRISRTALFTAAHRARVEWKAARDGKKRKRRG